MSDQSYSGREPRRRYRPGSRITPAESEIPLALTEEFLGMAVAYGNTLLFIGYEVNGLIEVVIYPRYRFPSDDRVQGYVGYLWVESGTPWESILADVDAVFDRAQENYRVAATRRAAETRAHGARYEAAYEAITEVFRESWHGIALRLQRQDQVVKEGVVFSGQPPGPVLAEWRDKTYTVMVFTTGSILMTMGDQRRSISETSG